MLHDTIVSSYCTVPYFGFKAKLKASNLYGRFYCTVPYFGFKAKRNRKKTP